jgi:hypothetical protein
VENGQRNPAILGEIGSVQNMYACRKLPGPTLVMTGGSSHQEKKLKRDKKRRRACQEHPASLAVHACTGWPRPFPAGRPVSFFSVSKALF